MLWWDEGFFFHSEAERGCLYSSDFQMLSLIGPPKERMSVYSKLALLLRLAHLPERWQRLSFGRNGFSWYTLMTGVIYQPENVPARRQRTESESESDEMRISVVLEIVDLRHFRKLTLRKEMGVKKNFSPVKLPNTVPTVSIFGK